MLEALNTHAIYEFNKITLYLLQDSKVSQVKSLSKILLALYILLLLWLVLFKFSLNISSVLDYQTRSINLLPFADASRDNLRGWIYNVVIFIPFGLLLSVNFKRANFWQKLTCVLIFSLAIEITQFVLMIGVSDITDIITNTLGGFLGLALYDLSKKYADNKKLDRFIVVAGTILLIVFILLLGTLLSRGFRYQSPHRASVI